MGKYCPWYWLLCRDRSAATRRCACFFSNHIRSMGRQYFKIFEVNDTNHFGNCVWKCGPLYRTSPYILCRERSVPALRCDCRIMVLVFSLDNHGTPVKVRTGGSNHVISICKLDRSLMIGWRKKTETLKGCPQYSLSCVSVRLSTRHNFRHKNLGFGLNESWDMRKKRFFSKFSFFTQLKR